MTLEKMTPEGAIERSVAHNLKRGKSRLEALYITAGFLNSHWLKEMEISIACHKGCGICCHQTFGIGGYEADYIHKWILRQPRRQREQILQRMYKRIRQFQSWSREQGVLAWFEAGLRLRPRVQEDIQEFLRLREVLARYKESCIFLNDDKGICSVYPARPMMCRTTRASEVCPGPTGGKMIRTPYDAELEHKIGDLEELPTSFHDRRDFMPLPLMVEVGMPEEERLARRRK